MTHSHCCHTSCIPMRVCVISPLNLSDGRASFFDPISKTHILILHGRNYLLNWEKCQEDYSNFNQKLMMKPAVSMYYYKAIHYKGSLYIPSLLINFPSSGCNITSPLFLKMLKNDFKSQKILKTVMNWCGYLLKICLEINTWFLIAMTSIILLNFLVVHLKSNRCPS